MSPVGRGNTRCRVTDDTLTFELSDGRSISAPLAWYPRLLHGTAEERTRGGSSARDTESTGQTSTKTSASRTCSPAGGRPRAKLRSRNGSDGGGDARHNSSQPGSRSGSSSPSAPGKVEDARLFPTDRLAPRTGRAEDLNDLVGGYAPPEVSACFKAWTSPSPALSRSLGCVSPDGADHPGDGMIPNRRNAINKKTLFATSSFVQLGEGPRVDHG